MSIRKGIVWLAIIAVVSWGAIGQYPPATPGVSRCTLFSTDHEKTAEGIALSPSSYFVKVGPQVVLVHLEFSAFQAKGLESQHSLVAVVSRAGGIGESARPRLVARDMYAADIPLVGLPQPYHILIAFKAKGMWLQVEPKNCS